MIWGNKNLQSHGLFPNNPQNRPEKEIVVFVLDSGIKKEFVGGDISGDLEFEVGHGSMVSKVIREECRKCKIISIKIEDLQGKVSRKYLLEGLLSVLTYSRNNKNNAVIINLSCGSNTYDTLEHEIIKKLHEEGVIIVASVGNDNSSQPFYPAAYPETIAVAAITRGTKSKTKYSNWGTYVDIAAFGSTLKIEQSFSDISSYSVEGTSFAAPLIAGILAKSLYRNPDMSTHKIIIRMMSVAKPIDDPLYEKGQLGRGLIESKDVYKIERTDEEEELERKKKITFYLFLALIVCSFLSILLTFRNIFFDSWENRINISPAFYIDFSNRLTIIIIIILGGIAGIFIGSGKIMSPPLLPKAENVLEGFLLYSFIGLILIIIYRLKFGKTSGDVIAKVFAPLKKLIENSLNHKVKKKQNKISSINKINYKKGKINYIINVIFHTNKKQIFISAYEKFMELSNPSMEILYDNLNYLEKCDLPKFFMNTSVSLNEKINQSHFNKLTKSKKKCLCMQHNVTQELDLFFANENINFENKYKLVRKIIKESLTYEVYDESTLDYVTKLLIWDENKSYSLIKSIEPTYLSMRILPILDALTGIKFDLLGKRIKRIKSIILEKIYPYS